MEAILGWYCSTAFWQLLEGSEAAYLEELSGLMSGRLVQPLRQVRVHQSTLMKIAEGLRSQINESPAESAVSGELRRVMESHGMYPAEAVVAAIGATGELADLNAQTRLLSRIQNHGPAVYWALLCGLFQEPLAMSEETLWAWFCIFARTCGSRRREFFRTHEKSLRKALSAGGRAMVPQLVLRLRKREARRTENRGIKLRIRLAESDLIIGFANYLIDRMKLGLEDAAWTKDLFVLEQRAGVAVRCHAECQSYSLRPGSARLLRELGDCRRVDCENRDYKHLIEDLPLVARSVSREFAGKNNKASVRGLGLVGRVIDIGAL